MSQTFALSGDVGGGYPVADVGDAAALSVAVAQGDELLCGLAYSVGIINLRLLVEFRIAAFMSALRIIAPGAAHAVPAVLPARPPSEYAGWIIGVDGGRAKHCPRDERVCSRMAQGLQTSHQSAAARMVGGRSRRMR